MRNRKEQGEGLRGLKVNEKGGGEACNKRGRLKKKKGKRKRESNLT